LENIRFLQQIGHVVHVSNQYRILLAILLAVIGGVVLWRVNKPRDPMYREEPLSQWLEEYDPRGLINNKEEVDAAVRHIGTNAIPILLEMLRSKDNPLKRAVLRQAERAELIWVSLARERDVEAERGFEALGESAKDAVPALIEIYKKKISPESQMATALSFGCIGPPAKKAIPELLEGATNANTGLRQCVIQSLGKIHSEPEVSVPVLIRALDDSDQQTRYEAANALGAFGTNAKSAIPALVRLFKSKDKHLYRTAAESLKVIDLEAAVEAGVK
jgi:HEAT repeat protein